MPVLKQEIQGVLKWQKFAYAPLCTEITTRETDYKK